MTMPTLLIQRAQNEAMGDDVPALPDKSRRRTFTAEYKLSIVAEYDACAGDGDKGALLRREGLYSSHVVEWRRARDNGAGGGRRGRPQPRSRPLSGNATPRREGKRRDRRSPHDVGP